MTNLAHIVLYVDDDEDDREIVSQAIQEIDPTLQVIEAEDGVKAIEVLTKAKEANIFPCLIILDINMPRMDGKRTLVEIKRDEQLKHLPVVIFSTNLEPEDKPFYDEYGVEIITKPSNLNMIRNEVQRLLKHCA
jgi:CheY-like chemotaxis protein